jgi:hypothetical protein
MSDSSEIIAESFSTEFGFLPPELVTKCHEFIRAYHDHHGSGWPFVKPQVLLSRHSPYLRKIQRACLYQFRLCQIAIVIAAIGLGAAMLSTHWLLIVVVGSLICAYWTATSIKFNLIQIRTLILSNEMLAADFAGWGDVFPKAKSKAEEWLKNREPGEEALFDVYMPKDQRQTFVEEFKPSSASVDEAYQGALQTLMGGS